MFNSMYIIDKYKSNNIQLLTPTLSILLPPNLAIIIGK